MADPTTQTVLDVSDGPKETTLLPPQSTAPATRVSDSEGWEVEDVGRVRGDTFDSMVQAERQIATRADGTDPSVLGDPDLPAPDISDDTDAGVVARAMDPDGNPVPHTKGAAKPESKGKLALSKRVEKLKGKIDAETHSYRELQRGNVDLARRILAEHEGRASDPRQERPASSRDDRTRRADGTFEAKPASEREPKVPDKPKRPIWEEYDEAGKTWADYNKDLAAYDDKREAYLDAVSEHRAWKVRQELGGEIAKRDRRMSEMTQATQRQRAEAAFSERRAIVQREYGEDRWKGVVDNWAEFDKQGYQSDALETIVQLHDAGARLVGVLGEQIEKAAVLADQTWTMAMYDGIMSLEDPSAVLLALADDPEAFERIAALPHARAIAALGALSGRLESAGPRAHGSRPAKVSKAPAPIRPIGGRREGGSTRTGDAAFSEDAPMEDYIRDTNARLSGRA